MTFLTPILLWGLVLLPIVLFGYFLVQRRRSRYAVRFTNLDLLGSVVQQAPGWRRHVPTALYLATLGLLIVSLARPQATIAVPREEATVVLVIDVSGSMGATDVEPNRLLAAQTVVAAFIEQLPGKYRVGLVSFSDSARALVDPTTEREPLEYALWRLRPEAGTAMGDGLSVALSVLANDEREPPAVGSLVATPAPEDDPPEPPPAAVLLLSDGANTSGRTTPSEAAAEASELDIPVFTIAYGSPDGVLEVSDQLGRTRTIPVPPDEWTLQQIAETTGGRFFAAPSAEELSSVYSDLGSRIGMVEEERDVTAFVAAAALVTLLFGGGLSALWFNRFP